MIKKLIFSVFILFFTMWWVFAAEEIKSFNWKIYINLDSSLEVQEEISYDFPDKRHWIFRDIPKYYSNENWKFFIKIEVESVKDEKWTPYKFKFSDEWSYFRIKIWDPNSYVSWNKNYIIKYSVKWAFKYLENSDELMWNITWVDWPVPIKSSDSFVYLPSWTKATSWVCYTWKYWSLEKNCKIETVSWWFNIFSNKAFSQKEWITFHLKFPAWTFEKVEFKKTILSYFPLLWPFLIPIWAFIYMYWEWRRYWKDPKKRPYTAPFYTPPKNLNAWEVWVIYDDNADSKDLVATIIQLAQKWYIKIIETEEWFIFKSKNYKFLRLKDLDSSLEEYEIIILHWIFSKTLSLTGLLGQMNIKGFSDLKNLNADDWLNALKNADITKESDLKSLSRSPSFKLAIKSFKEELFKKLVEKKYYEKTPKEAWKKYIIFIVLCFILTFLAIPISLLFWTNPMPLFMSWFISIFIFFIFSFYMTKKTQFWVETLEHILWFQLYLDKVEKKYIDFSNAPEKKPETFLEHLPFAIALWVEKAWAKEFKDLTIQNPSWYSSDSWTFDSVAFATSLSAFSSATSTSSSTSSWGWSGSWGWWWGWWGGSW